jgi:hypothetical protein
MLITGIGNRNWIYILAERKIQPSHHANEFQGVDMTTTTAPRFETRTATSPLARFFAAFKKELRRAIELAGAPYVNGPMPPL